MKKYVLNLNGKEVFRGVDVGHCLGKLATDHPSMTVKQAIMLGYEIAPWVCPGHQIVTKDGAEVCLKCGFISKPAPEAAASTQH